MVHLLLPLFANRKERLLPSVEDSPQSTNFEMAAPIKLMKD